MSKANSTLSITYKFKGETGGLRAMCDEVERMQRAFKEGVEPAERLKTSLVNFNQIAQSFEQIGQSVNAINGQIQELAAAYAVQIQAETKLEVVMRQRMAATDEQIQSIKDLCAAQQELGVVGDEVQLAGAQQLATFLNSREALAELIPAMNNLVVQQKGLGATQQDCAGIANLFGKAMQGQTSALRRVGITFTEAEEASLKTGTEWERAARLAQIITNNVGEMNVAMAQTDAGRAQQLANAMGDIKEQIGGVVSGIAPYAALSSQIITMAANAGRATSAMRGLYTATLGAKGAFGFLNRTMVASALGMNAAGRAAGVLAAGLRMVMAATAITLVLAAISAAVEYFTRSANEGKEAADGLADSTERLRQHEEQLSRSMEEVRAQLNRDIAATKDFNGTREEEKKLCAELNQRYGTTMGYFSKVCDWYRALVANSKAYCDQMVNEARARMLANQIATLEQQNDDAIYNPDGSKRKYSSEKTVKKYEKAYLPDGTETAVPVEIKQYKGSDLDLAVKGIKSRNQQIKFLRSRLGGTQPKVEMPVKGAATPPAETGSVRTGRSGTAKSGSGTARTAEKNALEQIEEQIRQNQVAVLTASDEERAALRVETAAMVKKRDALRELQQELVKPKEAAYVPPAETEIKTYEELDRALSHYNERLRTAQPEQRQEINDTIKRLEAMRDAWDKALNPPETLQTDRDRYIESVAKSAFPEFASAGSPLEGMDFTSLMSGYKQIERILSGLDGDITAEQRKSLREAAAEYGRYAQKAARSGATVRSAWGNIKGIAGGIESMKEALEGNGNAWSKISASVDAAISVFDGIKGLIEIVKTFTTVTNIQAAAEKAKSAEVRAGASEEVGAAAQKVAAAGKVTTANVAEGASGFIKANSSIPVVGIALAAAGVAALIALMAGLPKFADGGIAFGPTLGLFGEYAGASRNPEVVAPLDRLRSLIGETDGTPGVMVARVRGEQIEFVYDRRKRRKARM